MNRTLIRRRVVGGLVLGVAMGLAAGRAPGFSLLGPYADWMQPDIGYHGQYDIGGPMDFDEGYRWNVPIVTYGFDQSFVDYFGANGVAAVEGAIGILNDLPPASSIVLSNYPLQGLNVNFPAFGQGLLDLKSFTLSLLVEHLGLADPVKNIFVLRVWDTNSFRLYPTQGTWPPNTIPDYVLMRNFDPETFVPTAWVNNILYTCYVDFEGISAYMVQISEDPDAGDRKPVAEWLYDSLYDWEGFFFTGLTRDDVGGLSFLLSEQTQNYETLLPDVQASELDPSQIVNSAWRPGVEKITFMPQPTAPPDGHFVPYTYQYMDTYTTNGVWRRQLLQRVVTQPDFLFCAADTGATNSWTPVFVRTGTDGWSNNAALNWVDDPTKLGPGVIAPPVTITFHKLGPAAFTADGGLYSNGVTPWGWGSFEGSTNPPVAYPAADVVLPPELTLRLRLYGVLPSAYPYTPPPELTSITWQLPVALGGAASLQASTNLVDWVPLLSVTNKGSVIEWWDFIGNMPQGFFRAVPQ